jgi:hypothetical protein
VTSAAANQIAVRMLIGFIVALGALLLGVVLIRRMRQLVDDEFTADVPLANGKPEHRPILPPKSSTK